MYLWEQHYLQKDAWESKMQYREKHATRLALLLWLRVISWWHLQTTKLDCNMCWWGILSPLFPWWCYFERSYVHSHKVAISVSSTLAVFYLKNTKHFRVSEKEDCFFLFSKQVLLTYYVLFLCSHLGGVDLKCQVNLTFGLNASRSWQEGLRGGWEDRAVTSWITLPTVSQAVSGWA